VRRLWFDIRGNPLLWLLVFVPVVFVAERARPESGTLQFWPGAVVMVLLATLTAALVSNGGRSAWFISVLVLAVYTVFAVSLYLLPPR
jgi:Ca2+:H+ antiporter